MSAHVGQRRLTREHPRPQWMRHFARPEGFVGGIVGHFMAWKNAAFNRAAVEVLAPQADDHVLEIGYGPGTAIPLIAARARNGTVTGVDASARMLTQASRRTRRLIAEGRVSLHKAPAASMPFADASFDRVLAVNNFHIWNDRNAALQEIARVLKPGGTLMLAVRGAEARVGEYTPPGLGEEQIRLALEELRHAGFEDPGTRRVHAGRELIAISGHTRAPELPRKRSP